MPHFGSPFKALHLKKNTKGTSNEISLSVLDSAKQMMDERHGEARRVQQLGKIDLFSGEREPDYQVMSLSEGTTSGENSPGGAPASGGNGHSFGAEESKKEPFSAPLTTSIHLEKAGERQTSGAVLGGVSLESSGVGARTFGGRARKWVIVGVAALLVIAIVVLAVLGVSGFAEKRAEFKTLATEVIETIEESESPIVAMNELLADPSSDQSRSTISSVTKDLDSAERTLALAKEKLPSVEAVASTASEKETLARLEKDVLGRQEMVASGREVLSCLKTAQGAMTSLEEAWSAVGEANEAANKASRMVSNNTEIDSALEEISKSSELITSAQEKVQKASEAYPSADLTTLQRFLEAKSIAIQKEMEAIQALKNLDAATARACQAEYEEYEEAAQLALSGIDNVDKPIVDAYQVKIEDYAARYEAARAEVALSDEYLRDFLGQASK